MNTEKQVWTFTIRSGSRWFDLRLRELWNYRDLLSLLIWRDFVSVYKQTVLGPLWYLARPLITALTYTAIFGYAIKIHTDETPRLLFFMSGIVPWTYFQTCVTSVSGAFVSNVRIFGKVYFPRLVIPLSMILSNLVSFGIQLVLLLVFLVGYMLSGANVGPSTQLIWFPFLLLISMASALGIGLLTASLSARYRDLIQLVGFGVQLLMYLTPVVYPTSLLPESVQAYTYLNPMVSVVEGMRIGLLGSSSFNMSMLAVGTCVSGLLLLIGIMAYSRSQDTLVDTI